MEHHVYFWLTADRDNPADRAAFEQGLADLLKLGSVAGGCWATPAPTPERPVTDHSWHYALSMKFDSVENHDAYQVDPDHDVFVDRFKTWWQKVEVRDLLPR